MSVSAALQMCMRVAGTGSAVSVGLKAHIPDGGGQGSGQSGVALSLLGLEALILAGLLAALLVSRPLFSRSRVMSLP